MVEVSAWTATEGGKVGWGFRDQETSDTKEQNKVELVVSGKGGIWSIEGHFKGSSSAVHTVIMYLLLFHTKDDDCRCFRPPEEGRQRLEPRYNCIKNIFNRSQLDLMPRLVFFLVLQISFPSFYFLLACGACLISNEGHRHSFIWQGENNFIFIPLPHLPPPPSLWWIYLKKNNDGRSFTNWPDSCDVESERLSRDGEHLCTYYGKNR